MQLKDKKIKFIIITITLFFVVIMQKFVFKEIIFSKLDQYSEFDRCHIFGTTSNNKMFLFLNFFCTTVPLRLILYCLFY